MRISQRLKWGLVLLPGTLWTASQYAVAANAVGQASGNSSALEAQSFRAADDGGGDHAYSHIVETNGVTSLSIKLHGKIELTDDGSDVKSLSPGGHFYMEERHWSSHRSYDVKADSAGQLTKTYAVGKHAQALDADGREWLAKTMLQVTRETGWGARQRVLSLIQKGGAQAVLTEVAAIHSDGVRRAYLEGLFLQASLTSAELKDAARLIGEISSDGDKAQAIVVADSRYFTDDLRSSLFDAIGSIHSDGDKRRVLVDVARKDGESMETLSNIAKVARHISSDGDKAAILMEISRRCCANDAFRRSYFEAANSISSDGDHARVLSELLSGKEKDGQTTIALLQSARRISSDGDKARVLLDTIPRYAHDGDADAQAEPMHQAFFAAVNSISSDGDRQAVLSRLSRQSGIGAATMGGIADSAARLSSDGDKARVLRDLAEDGIEPIRSRFFAAADSIRSDSDHSAVLRAVLDKSGVSEATVIAAIESAARISSDGEKASVLMNAARHYASSSKNVQAALRKALESVRSDGEYRQVMTALPNQQDK